MTGDYSKVALRSDERWERAPAQQGRALLDHELNLNVDATVRRDLHLAGDVIGAAGVVAGSTAFQVSMNANGPIDLTIDAGRMWVAGRAALAPQPFQYSGQDQIAALPASGRALVYLDTWDEHIHPAEDLSLIDPALGHVDTATRTRVGYRVRVTPTTATTCTSAWAGFNPDPLSTGALTAVRIGPPIAIDPCDPPGDAQGLLPDGLLRVEALDEGSASTARLAWSYENGSAAVAVAGLAGNVVTLQPSASVKFGLDLVEVSWLARRADRLNSGSLYTIQSVASSAGGDVLTLDRPVTAPAGAAGLVVRRWDGEVVGAAQPQNASRAGVDLGVRFNLTAGNYRPGDWWGIRVREATGVDPLTNAPPDGTAHAFAPLALIDLTARTVTNDCRPTFRPLTDIETGSACTVVVGPGGDLQAAVDSLPPGGGEVCLAAGDFPLATPVIVKGRDKVKIVGVGPATVVRSTSGEVVMVFVESDDVEVADLRIVARSAGKPPGDRGLNGALTFEGCRGVTVRSVHANVPDGAVRTQAAITAREFGNRRPERVTVADCRLVIGTWQIGVLVTNGRDVAIERNHVSLGPAPIDRDILIDGRGIFVDELTRLFAASRSTERVGIRPTVLPTGSSVNLEVASPVVPLVDEWVRIGAASTLPDRAAFRRFVSSVVDDGGARLTPAGLGALLALGRRLRAIGQGIVIGGDRAETIRIDDNVIREAVQGIHVGVSKSNGAPREAIDEVLVSRNAIHLRVPTTYRRERHAVFVGNVESAQIVDTRATVERSLDFVGVGRTPVDAVHLFGFFGQFINVRGGSFSGFDVGVRAQPLGPIPTRRVWSISEVAAAGLPGALGAVAPASFNRLQVVP